MSPSGTQWRRRRGRCGQERIGDVLLLGPELGRPQEIGLRGRHGSSAATMLPRKDSIPKTPVDQTIGCVRKKRAARLARGKTLQQRKLRAPSMAGWAESPVSQEWQAVKPHGPRHGPQLPRDKNRRQSKLRAAVIPAKASRISLRRLVRSRRTAYTEKKYQATPSTSGPKPIPALVPIRQPIPWPLATWHHKLSVESTEI